jgi:hypothetical protein
MCRWDNESGEPATWSMVWDELSTAEQNAALNVCWIPELWDKIDLDETAWGLTYESFLPGLTEELDTAIDTLMDSFPYTRYLPWLNIAIEDRDIAESSVLEYSETRWDKIGKHPLEEYAFYDICRGWSKLSDTPTCEATDALEALGLDEDTWNCWMFHAPDYEWDDLGSYQQWYIELGWSKDAWDEAIAPPLSESKDWFDLTYSEKIAVTHLCYIPETWDGLDIPDWAEKYQTLPPSETRAPTALPATEAPSSAPTSTCFDTTEQFLDKRGRPRDCAFVAANPGRQCGGVTQDGTPISWLCPVTCDYVCPDPTPAPTSAPTGTPAPTGACSDTSEPFTDKRGRPIDCAWAAANPRRCTASAGGGIPVSSLCPVTCDTCPSTSDGNTEEAASGSCADSTSSFSFGGSTVDCAWVGAKRGRRCKDDALSMCPVTCDSCDEASASGGGNEEPVVVEESVVEEPASGSCADSTSSFSFNGGATVDCAWVGAKAGRRCKGDALSMCPVTCDSCDEVSASGGNEEPVVEEPASGGSCADSASSFSFNGSTVDCAWVGAKRGRRCKDDALSMCPVTCNTCP